MIEYFIFILMIIAGVAIIAFAVDKRRRRGRKAYAGISSKGTVTRTASGYRSRSDRDRYAPDSENPDKRYDSLFSGKKEDKKDRYRKIMDRRKNIRPGEVEIPVTAWSGSEDTVSSNKPQASAKNGKYGHLFSADSSASTSKLAKLKRRAIEVYDEQYRKEDVPEKEEKPSIFSMFGGGNAEENTPPTPPPVQNSFEPEMRREEVQPIPERESVPETQSFGGFRPPENNVNGNSGMSRMPEENNPRPPEPQPNNDDAAKDDAFNRMLGFEPKKDPVPKKKNDNEWTPMF